MRILFVCTGNTCRSPMAEKLTAKMLERFNLGDDIQLMSAGLAVLPGEPASSGACYALRREGIDLSNHRAQQLTKEMVEEADLILTMTASQKRHLLEIFPMSAGKVFVLKEFAERGYNLEYSEKLLALLRRLNAKKERFWEANSDTVRELKEERESLLQRLREIEDKLAAIEGSLAREIQEEKDAIRKLEEQLMRYDITDPFGQSDEVYCRCADELAQAVEGVCRHLQSEQLRD
ncbi:MAG: low molecular weight protein arginine phosphatase [Thermoanaerobacterales bacterium]|nr:low molecular weight protein arginine phosphatase [Thermoanaerobacterales bacterium]